MMPLTHDHRRLVLALQMAGKTAGVVRVVVPLFTVERLIARRRIPDLQLVANLVRVAILAPAAKKDPAVDVWGAGAEVDLELEIRVVLLGREPAAGSLGSQDAIDNLPLCFALRHKVVQRGAIKEQLPALRLFFGGEYVRRAAL